MRTSDPKESKGFKNRGSYPFGQIESSFFVTALSSYSEFLLVLLEQNYDSVDGSELHKKPMKVADHMPDDGEGSVEV